MALDRQDLAQIEKFLREAGLIGKRTGHIGYGQADDNFIRQRTNMPPNLQGQMGRALTAVNDIQSQLNALEALVTGLDVETRLAALEGLNAGTRLTAIEAWDADTRLDVLEALDISDRLDALEVDAHRVHVFRSTPFTATTGVNNYIGFGSERYDEPSNDQHDQVTNNARLTCTKTGKYLVYGAVEWEPSAGGTTRSDVGYRRVVFIERHDSGGGDQVLAKTEDAPLPDAPDLEQAQLVMTEIELTLNDYVRLGVKHDHTSDIDIVNTAYSAEFGMARIGSN